MQPWQQLLSEAITDLDQLFLELKLDLQRMNSALKIVGSFPLRVPRGFVSRMEKGNPQDPLLLQVLPVTQELDRYPGYSDDPLNEKSANRMPGILHKYHGRVLLTLSGGCAIHCRYCFRRYFPYDDNMPNPVGWKKILDYIANDQTIEEVIFSGGDPLILKDKSLALLVQQIEMIAHVKRLRIHTRLPIVIPERVDDELIRWLQATRLKTIVVLHCNHSNEINAAVMSAVKKLQAIAVTLFNQSVLLKNINDNANTLIKLSHQLFDAGIMPYYLHVLDRVQGSAHFEVSEAQATQLLRE